MNPKILFVSLCCLFVFKTGAYATTSNMTVEIPAPLHQPQFSLTPEQATGSILVMKFMGGFVANPNCSVEILRSGEVISRCPRRNPVVIKLADLSPKILASIEKAIDSFPTDGVWSHVQTGPMAADFPIEQVISVSSNRKQTLLYQIWGQNIDGLKENFKDASGRIFYSYQIGKSLKDFVAGFSNFMN